MKKYSDVFAENLYRFRKEMKMTQEQLAKKICYTEKAVSKWESGGSVPPAETLILLAEVFNVSLDELFNHCTHPSYYLGIDGGATKTTFALADSQGTIIRKIVLGPSNPFDLSFDKVTRVLSDGIEEITKGISKRKISLFAGIAGCGNPEMRDRVSSYLGSLGFISALVDSDAQNIISDSLAGGDGVIVIMGTGSSCFVQLDGTQERIGGFGYLFDHGGSGYDIGNDAISAVCRMSDGRAEPSLLADYLYRELGVDNMNDCLSKLYDMGKRGIASLSRVVFNAYDNGDMVAEQILRKNMAHVADLLIASARRFYKDEKIKAVMIGGLTNRWDVLGPMLYEALGDQLDRFDIRVYSGDVVHGALLLAGMPTQISN